MPPSKRAKRFDRQTGEWHGVPYALSEDGRLVVGSSKSRVFARLPAGANIIEAVAKLAARQLPAQEPPRPHFRSGGCPVASAAAFAVGSFFAIFELGRVAARAVS